MIKNSPIVAIARIIIKTIYASLVNGKEFVDKIDPLTERKIKAMRSRLMRKTKISEIDEIINDLMVLCMETQKGDKIERNINNEDAIT